MEIVHDRTAPTLVALIKKWIKEGSIIYSDCFRSYSRLGELGYIHKTINHSQVGEGRFKRVEVDEQGETYVITTNKIEHNWAKCKKFIPREGNTNNTLQAHIDTFCYFKNVLRHAEDRFISFLNDISTIYRKEGKRSLERSEEEGLEVAEGGGVEAELGNVGDEEVENELSSSLELFSGEPPLDADHQLSSSFELFASNGSLHMEAEESDSSVEIPPLE